MLVHKYTLFLHIHAGYLGHQYFRVLLFPEYFRMGAEISFVDNTEVAT